MPVTRTKRACPYCGYPGVEEFGGMCAACASEHRYQMNLAMHLWCRFCGATDLFEEAHHMKCMRCASNGKIRVPWDA